MKNTIGNYVTLTLFGESHGTEIGAVLDGIAPGIAIDENLINIKLARRRPCGKISTARVETDEYSIVSGVYNGRTTGTPLCVVISNRNIKSGDYAALAAVPRPGHADYTAQCKYHGWQDARGGGHFSGRLTAPIVAMGAIAESALAQRGVRVATHVLSLGGVKDRHFCDIENDIEHLRNASEPVFSSDVWDKMNQRVLDAAASGDSVGGILECAIVGLPAGIGEPYFDSLESVLSHAVFSIPAVKGVEFGDGFALAEMKGSEANDAYRVENGSIVTETNHAGGIYGGISSGAPIILRAAIKPTPSISREQHSVDISKMTNTSLSVKGRHDPAIVHRAAPVLDAIVAIALLDVMTGRYGADYFTE